MAVAGNRAARVAVDYSQYWVRSGPDIGGGDDSVPGLLVDLGPQAVAVITGLHDGRVTVTAQAVQAPPASLDPGWDVAAETDLEFPDGVIVVCDWGDPDHGELGPLAAGGPGRYRLRVHARNRRQVGQRQSTEEHHLLTWPVTAPAPPRLLTPLDEFGRVFNGERPSGAPGLDDLDRAAAAGVRHLADLVAQPGPPRLSGELTVVCVEAIAPATPRRVWDQVAIPWGLVGSGGGGNPAVFEVYLHKRPRLKATGHFVTEEPFTGLAFTWSWTTTRTAEGSEFLPVVMERDLLTGGRPQPSPPIPSGPGTRRYPGRCLPSRPRSASACAAMARRPRLWSFVTGTCRSNSLVPYSRSGNGHCGNWAIASARSPSPVIPGTAEPQ